MSENLTKICFLDHIGPFPPDYIYWPDSLKFVASELSALRTDEMLKRPEYFNANIRDILATVLGFFEAIHETHEEALQTYDSYRNHGRQYCLYLRSFLLSGQTLTRSLKTKTQLLGWTGGDRNLKQLLKRVINGRINCLSSVNTHDVHMPRSRMSPANEQTYIPSVRLLSHNWRETVRELILGSKLIVLDLDHQSEGVMMEVDLIRECQMAQRTICIVSSEDRKLRANALSDFREVIMLPTRDFESDDISFNNLRTHIVNLVGDDFSQANTVRDLSGLKCYVVDRHIEPASKQFDAELLANLQYEDYIPSSLINNWNLLSADYPKLLEQWDKIGEKIREGPIKGPLVVEVMFRAVRTFPIAATLERYKEMLVTLWYAGAAHYLQTGKRELRDDCWNWAANCAAWDGNVALSEFYRKLVREGV